ncbi:cobalt-zinc-cadmium resistance protein [Massilia sp. KIM]|uniref:TolC family protein n=1 Tax=Massilia sp. KIM TaxID=1955422 RepID=UPI00098F8D49|nr:TolC family protein [Massilia sp. KIM]OON62108.1 cobalt-zinc-cadmium resistance protein [Massilia sp. KIM]
MSFFTRPRKHVAILAAILATAPAVPVAAPLTLAAAIELAERASPALRAAAHEVAAQDGALAQAGALPNPELELLREGQRRDTRTTTAQLNIPFELGGKRAARVALARSEGELARRELSALRAELRADTAAAFHELVLAAERQRLAGEMAALAARALDAAARRVQAGKVSPVDETRARIAEANARIELLQAGRALQEARVRLAALWGGEPAALEPAAPEAPPPVLPLAQLAARLDAAPAMRRALARVAQREAEARLARTQRTPDLTLVLGTRREGQDAGNQAVVGLSVPLPLFNRNEGALRQALSRVDQAREQQAGEGARLRADLAQAHARLLAARDEAALVRGEILPGARSAWQAASRGFEAGKFGFLEVLEAQRTLFQSQLQALQADAEIQRAAAEIARLTGASAFQENP